LNRVSTDGSAIIGAPLLVGKTLVVATQKGGVFAFRPE
jgi:outer membrane protein assembly factor BamB